MKVLFVGGLFSSKQIDFINSTSSGVVQNAADVLQKNIIKSLKLHAKEVEVVNLPFIGSYPALSSCLYFPPVIDDFGKAKITGLGFLNLPFIKHFSRFISLTKYLFSIEESRSLQLLVYSYHLPFMISAYLFKRFSSGVNIFIVVPDLPEYMSDNNSFVYRFLKRVEVFFGDALLKKFDGYIFLTNQMAVRYGVDRDDYIVVEGVADISDFSLSVGFTDSVRYIFYSGTLAERYGIRELVDSYISLDIDDIQLFICGEGDSRGYIESCAKQNSKIKFFGQLSREKVIELQKNALLLVNPRRADSEFTKYSFPSKVIEYMSSGRPVLMNVLPGIPEEYYDYCFSPSGHTVSDFTNCLRDTLKLDPRQLDSMGANAKKFIEEKKSYSSQGLRIYQFLMRKI